MVLLLEFVQKYVEGSKIVAGAGIEFFDISHINGGCSGIADQESLIILRQRDINNL